MGSKVTIDRFEIDRSYTYVDYKLNTPKHFTGNNDPFFFVLKSLIYNQ